MNLIQDDDFLVDEYGNVIRPKKRTPITHPYNYDPFVIWQSSDIDKATDSVYSDRMFQHDSLLFNHCCKACFGDEGQCFDNRDPLDIEKFLIMYLKNTNVVLTKITQHCNQSSGFPLWRFDYYKKKANK
ncbi:MAG: hypothetical protein JETCAE03_31930 [Ignavibacteriaceae bacterium]|jgi:hypothetical protein|nr:MAG: hypothetical protein JETCAE03_31930 [Ignavibacteriaceae bacterium]